ncbi:MAG TPA: RteC domain-containing protein [Puia sp.]|nr:RteC domain-containing protein [Puia sp.]
MLTLVKKRYEELLHQLDILDRQHEPENPPVDFTPIVIKAVNEIADTLSTYAFDSKAEEAACYREGIVPLLSLIGYESEKYAQLRILYYGTDREFDSYCVTFIHRVTEFIYRHFEFFSYCFSGSRNHDARYFVPDSQAGKQDPGVPAALLDKEAFGVYNVLAASLIGYVRNCRDIESFYEVPMEESGSTGSAPPTLQWTDSAIALVELIYALYVNGSFNHGQAALKEISECFEQVFHIDLGNIYRVHQDMLYRKSGTTAFLDRLRKKLDDAED